MMQDTVTTSKRATILWMLAFFAAMFGGAALSYSLKLPTIWSAGIMLTAMLLLVPMVRSAERAAGEAGMKSPAIKRYNKRFVTLSFLYVAALMFSVVLVNSYEPHQLILWPLAILPTLPVIGMVWVMARLMLEEDDEYQRMKMTNSALIGTAVVLIVSTCWGFLETFGLVPHIWTWVIFPIWSTSFGVAQLFGQDRP